MLKSAQLITKPYQAFYRNTKFARKSIAYPLQNAPVSNWFTGIIDNEDKYWCQIRSF